MTATLNLPNIPNPAAPAYKSNWLAYEAALYKVLSQWQGALETANANNIATPSLTGLQNAGINVGNANILNALGGAIFSLLGTSGIANLSGVWSFMSDVATLIDATEETIISPLVFINGYYEPGDGGGGLYYLGATTTPNGGTIINDASGRSWYLLPLSGNISLRQFGAKGDGSHDDTAAMNAWFDVVLSSGLPGRIPNGNYKITSQLVWDFGPVYAKGYTIFGDSSSGAIINLDAVSTSPAFLITATVGGTPYPYFYGNLNNFGIEGNINGTLFQIGTSSAPTISQMNDTVLSNIWVANAGVGGSSIAMTINGCYGVIFENMTVNGAPNVNSYASLMISGAEFCTFLGGSYSSAKSNIVFNPLAGLSDVFGNNFFNLDTENCYGTNIEIYGNTYRNTFLGGQVASAVGVTGTSMVSCSGSSPSENVFINPNNSVTNYVYPGSTGGFSIKLNGPVTVSLPAVPASGTEYVNETGFDLMVYIVANGATISGVNLAILGVAIDPSTRSVMLRNGDGITLTYSGGTPFWYGVQFV